MIRSASSPLLKVLSLGMAALFVGAPASRSDEAAFFKTQPKAPEHLAADRIYPQGRQFLFTFYSVGGGTRKTGEEETALLPEEKIDAAMARYKKAGFSIFGPQYELVGQSLKDAQKHEMQLVYSVGLKVKFTKQKVEIDEEEVTRELTRQVSAVAHDPRIVAWDLRPEELRPWRKEEMNFLKFATKAIREADPLKRPIYHYVPGHASAKRMVPVAPYIDLLGKGMYPNYSGMKNSRVWCRWTIEQEIAAIKEANSSAVPLSISEMFQQPAPEELPKIPAWVRHDLYLSLVSGSKGIIVFSLRERDKFQAWEAYYQAYQQVGSELLGEKKLGDVFLFGEKQDDLTLNITEGPAEVGMIYPSGGVREPISYPSVAYLNTAYGDSRYLFLVNSANEAVSVEVAGIPSSAKAQNLFANGGEPQVSAGIIKTELQPLEVQAYRLTRP